jgi:hypothetical protein
VTKLNAFTKYLLTAVSISALLMLFGMSFSWCAGYAFLPMRSEGWACWEVLCVLVGFFAPVPFLADEWIAQ